jgi:hypothetical protein
MQANPQAAVLPVDVGHGHPERGANARECVDEQGDQRPISQADDRFDVDAVE